MDWQIDDENQNIKNSKLIRGICAEKSYISKGKVHVKSKDVVGEMDYGIACAGALSGVQYFFEQINLNLDKLQKRGCDLKNPSDIASEQYKPLIDEVDACLMFTLVCCQKYCDKLKTDSIVYENMLDYINDEINCIRNRLYDGHFYNIALSSALYALQDRNKFIRGQIFSSDTLYTINEANSLIEKYIPKDYMDKNGNMAGMIIMNAPTELVKRLEKSGYLKEGDKRLIDTRWIESVAENDNLKKSLNYETRFLQNRSCVTAYLYNLIDLRHLKKNFDVGALFDTRHLKAKQSQNIEQGDEHRMYFVNNEDNHLTYKDHGDMIMKILRDVEPDICFSLGFWNYYMNGILTREQLDECCINGYMDTHEVMSAYMNRHKILSEVQQEEKSENEDIDEEYMFIFDDEEKLLQFFTPDVIASTIANGGYDELIKIFVDKHLKKMYEKHNRDLLQEVFDDVLNYFDKENNPDFEKSTMLISMYQNGHIGIEQLNDDRISKQDIEEILDKGLQCKPLIADMYNNDLVDGETILEKYPEDDIFDFISEGMNPSVILGFYSTRELVDIIIGNKFKESCDLSCLKSDIDIDEIKKMYQPSFGSVEDDKSDKKMVSGLSYDDLARLVEYGLITEEEADIIDQEYDYKLKLDQLMDEGLIVGDKNGIKVARKERNSKSSNVSYSSGKIEDEDKQHLYLALDDEYVEFELGSSVLKHYKLVIMPKNKIAIMEPDEEGKGASYVMSIKLALDQISNNQLGESDKIDPLKEYRNRTGIRSIPGMETVNHRENWGYNLQKKMKKIHKNMDQLIYLKDKNEDEKAKRKLKIESIQKDIQSKYIIAREESKLLGSDNLETEDID